MKFKNIMLTEWSQTWKSAVFWFHLCEDQTSKTGKLQLPVMDLKRAHRPSLGFWQVLYLFLRLLIYLVFFWLHWVFIAASRLSLVVVRSSLVAQRVKCLPAMQETWVWSLGQEDPLATHSSTLAWKNSWTEKPGRLQSMGSQRARHDWVTSLHFTFCVIYCQTRL